MVIDQKHGIDWSLYNADCTLGMRGLPDNSIDFNVHSPPFVALYIYSDSVADLGNVSNEKEFFIGYKFAISEMFRVCKPGKLVAVHCKDTMRYITSHGYAGLYDFPGDIIRAYESIGFSFRRWITIWKNPVVEMQRTKTYGLLHKHFKERGEVTRHGCADFVLMFQKPPIDIERTPEHKSLSEMTANRMRHQWTNADDQAKIDSPAKHLSIWTKDYPNPEELSRVTDPGRLTAIHCQAAGYMPLVIKDFESTGDWKFHSRLALTDGTFIVAFRNWKRELRVDYSSWNAKVKHDLKSPLGFEYYSPEGNEYPWFYDTKSGNQHHDYVGNDPPRNWHDDTYYSILVWQKYASPAWSDLDGLPDTNEDIWTDIKQTNVLNSSLVKREEGEKHICPLQLDLIARLISEYTQPGEVVMSPYAGISSEIYQALRLERRGVGFELKPEYFEWAAKYLREAEIKNKQMEMML